MDEAKVVVAHSERVTLRVGDVFLKVDADQARIDVEVEAMSLAPVPTPEVLWRKPSVLAIAALAVELDDECESLVTSGLLPVDLVARNREVAEAALRPWTAAFTHGDLQIAHVFVDGDEVTGIIDWSEAGRGDALYDLATFTLGHEEHLRRRRRRLWHRHRPRRDPRVVVVAKPAGGSLADRARLRPVRAGLRSRRAQIPDVRRVARLRSTDGRSPRRCGAG